MKTIRKARSGWTVSRRGLLGSSVALGIAGCNRASSAETPEPARRASDPLAQPFTIAASPPADGKYYYMHDPGMALLASGAVLVAAPCLGSSTVGAVTDGSVRTFIARSSDHGATWDRVATLPYSDATPFVHDGALYMFVQRRKWEDVSIVTSADEGATWTEPVVLFRGSYWNCHTSMAFVRGRLHWALQTDDPSYSNAGLVVIGGDPAAGLARPEAWRMSTKLAFPGIASALTPLERPTWWGKWDAWLEPNTVAVNGRVKVLLRTVIDGYATTGAAAVCELTGGGDGDAMELAFSQFFPMPGAQNKFFILRDEPSRLFWMLSNLAADSLGAVFDWDAVRAGGHFLPGPGNDRRFLMLSYSVDALNWFPAGCVARTSDPHHSFMYPAAAVDGDDLVLIARSSLHGQNQHDADAVTFHRVRRFRDLAMDLYPGA